MILFIFLNSRVGVVSSHEKRSFIINKCKLIALKVLSRVSKGRNCTNSMTVIGASVALPLFRYVSQVITYTKAFRNSKKQASPLVTITLHLVTSIG
jgi:hypothetical protein